MEHHLISVLKRHSSPVEAETIHNLVIEKNTPKNVKNQNTPKLLSDLIIQEISKVAEWLTHAARNQEYAKKYAIVRAEIVQKSGISA